MRESPAGDIGVPGAFTDHPLPAPAQHLEHDPGMDEPVAHEAAFGARDSSLPLPLAHVAGWTAADVRAVDTARMLAADTARRRGDVRPGSAMSLAPLAYLLHQQVMRHDPTDPDWVARDRLVLSGGQSGLLLATQLHFSGYDPEADLDALLTRVENATGPPGQGVANAVGMAMAARRVRGLLDRDPPFGASPFDHFVYVLAGDRDLMEGACAEASSLAGHQELGNLVVFHGQHLDPAVDGTLTVLSEDVPARYRAYGWHVQTIDFTATGEYVEDVDSLLAAVHAAQSEPCRPSLIVLRTMSSWPLHVPGMGADEEAAALCDLLGFDAGWDAKGDFEVEPETLRHVRKIRDHGRRTHVHWLGDYGRWKSGNPRGAALLGRLRSGRLPFDWHAALPDFDPSDGHLASRPASGAVLAATAEVLPELWGGSADLVPAPDSAVPGEPSFLPESRQTAAWPGGPYGRTVHFGMRGHAMAAILNGIAIHGLTRPYGAAPLAASDHMRPAVRQAAQLGIPVIHLWDDSQAGHPAEQLAALRAIPGLAVVRPGDANETVACWRAVLERGDGPAALILSGRELPVLERGVGGESCSVASEAMYGGYILRDPPVSLDRDPEVLLIATGPEVAIALTAQEVLARADVAARVVSMPCREWFDEQRPDYRDMVLPPHVRARVAVEAGIPVPWRDLVGDAGRVVCLQGFSASPGRRFAEPEPDRIAEAVAHAARESITETARTP